MKRRIEFSPPARRNGPPLAPRAEASGLNADGEEIGVLAGRAGRPRSKDRPSGGDGAAARRTIGAGVTCRALE